MPLLELLRHRYLMRRPTPLPDHLVGRPFLVGDAAPDDVSVDRLRRPDVRAPRWSVRTTTPAPSVEGLAPWDAARILHVDAAVHECVRLHPASRFSHITAAIAHGMPLRLARIRGSLLHVSVAASNDRRRRSGVRVHPIGDEAVEIVHELPVTTPVTTWCDLAALLSVDELVEIGDWLVRRQDPPATMADLDAAVDRRRGRHGAPRLRAALPLVRPRTDSPKETELRLILLRAGLPEPEVNASVRDRFGVHVKWGDLVYESAKVLVEYDGEQHRTDDAQYGKDADDSERLIRAGWLIVHVRKAHLRDPRGVAARVRSALASRGAT